MNIWRFFHVPENVEEYQNIRPKDKFPLYAITTKQKFAEGFKIGRNMDRFVCKKSKVSKEEAQQYLSLNRGCVLEYKTFMSSPILKSPEELDGKYIESYELLVTQNEFNIVDEVCDCLGFLDDVIFIPTSIFSNTKREALDAIGYYEPERFIPRFMIEDIVPCTLGVFIRYYSDIINLDEFAKTIHYK